MTPEKIKKARAIIDAATSGPWEHDWENAGVEVPYPNRKEIVIRGEDDNYNSNLEFIAAARIGWPRALDEIERLQEIFSHRLENLENENKKLRIVAKEAAKYVMDSGSRVDVCKALQKSQRYWSKYDI